MRLRHGVAAVVAAWALGLVVPSPAAASCAASPRPSPYAFVGTVIDTEEGGRVATVVTDEGMTLTVLGTQDSSWLSNSYTSVDRRYAVGGRYEFHPLNGEPPYRDNACTATRQLAGPPVQAPEPPALLPGWLPVDEQAGPVGYLLFFGPLAAAVLILVGLARRLHRRSLNGSG